MAKVGSAYVDIKPDVKVREFIESLKTQLAAIKTVVTYKVKVVPDTKGFTAALTKQLKNAPAVRMAAKQAGAQLGDDMAKSMDDTIAQAWRDNRDFDKALKERTRHQQAAMERSSREISRGLTDQVKEMNRLHAEALKDNSDYDRAIADRTRHQVASMERASREIAQGLRNQAKEMNRVHAEALRDNTEFDRAIRQKTRDQERAMQQSARQIAAGLRDQQRQLARAQSEAIRMNDLFDKKRATEAASTVWSRFTSALSATSGGWTRLIANPIGAVLIAAFTAIVGSIVVSWVAALAGALVGVGFIGLGAFLLRNQPDVVSAAKRLGDTFTKTFGEEVKRSAPAFTAALDTLTAAVPGWARDFGSLLNMLGPQIENLARGIRGFVDGLFAGLRQSMPTIQALVDGLSKGLPRIGKALGDVFAKIDPKEAASTMEGLLVTAENLLHVMGSLAATSMVWANNIRVGWRNTVSFLSAVKQMSGPEFAANNLRMGFGMDEENRNVTAWKKFWNEFSGHTDREIEKNKAKLAELEAAFNNVVKAATKKFPALGLEQIENVVEQLRVKFGDAAVATAWFGEQVDKTLHGIQREIVKTNWEKFGEDAANGFKSVGLAADKTRKEIDDLVDSMDILNKRFMDSEDAVDNFYDAQDKITELINDPKFIANVDRSTVVGRERVSLIRDEARAVDELLKAQIKNGSALPQIMTTFHEYTSQIKLNAQSLGMSKQAAEDYLRSLKLTPENILTQLTLAGVPGALEELEKITGQKAVNVTANADVNQFALVGEYIVNQMKATGSEAGLTFEEFLRKKAQDAFIANQGQYVGLGAATAMAITEGAKEQSKVGPSDVGKQWRDSVKADQELHRENYRLMGQNSANWITSGAVEGTKTGQESMRRAGEQSAKAAADGIKTAPGASAAGAVISQTAADGVSANWQGIWNAGVGLAKQLAAGLSSFSAVDVVKGAASGLASLIGGFFKSKSPPKYGPLSGTGALEIAGRSLASQLADGMLKGESEVASAATTLASAVRLPGTMLGATTYDALGRPVVITNVHIGNEQLDAYIVNTIDADNEALARSMLAGRSGVG